MTATVASTDPRTGQVVESVAHEFTAAEVDAACRAAAATAAELDAAGPTGRARLLRAMADELEADAETIIALADRESALGATRLRGELARSSFQLRMFAAVLDDGAYLDVTIDHANPDSVPIPVPDLRRMLVPLGAVAVFGASNFPLAFSVPGGDTASALAAGCPVVVKAHPAHPATSERCAQALRAGAAAAGFPADVLVLVHGGQAGAELVRHPAIRAVGFTGSLAGGRALFDLATSRPDPIPFYGELGSINPVVITAAAAVERAEQIAAGLLASYTGGAGQFCTKPGLVFVPAGEAGQRIRDGLAAGTRDYQPTAMLAARIRDAYRDGADARAKLPGVNVLAESADPGASAAANDSAIPNDSAASNGSAGAAGGADPDGGAGPNGGADGGADGADGEGFLAPARLLGVPAQALRDDAVRTALFEECFGPLTVLVDYRDDAQLGELLAQLPGSLTATVHAGASETPTAPLELLRQRAGRIVWNGYPTGVAVTWATQHGGPYPSSTDSRSTSVGAAAIGRWLRPIAYQSTPDALLPPALQEANPWHLPRRVDGVSQLPT